MERHAVIIQEKLSGLLKEAAEVSVALDRLNGTIQGVPHDSVIELRAHELDRQLSRQIQQRHMTMVVNHQLARAGCPACDAQCELKPVLRRTRSIDGPLDLQELKGHCRKCRRAFSPPPRTGRL